MTAIQKLIEVAALRCTCIAALSEEMRAAMQDRKIVSQLLGGGTMTATVKACDACVADSTLIAIETTLRVASETFLDERARVACLILADRIAARDSDDLVIPDCEDEE